MIRHAALRSFVLLTFAASLIGFFSGLASSFFLISLEFVTKVFQSQPTLIWFLPLGGFAVGLLYLTFGRTADRGTNLIIEEIHDPKETIPFRMAPLVLFGTLITHLFGGSAGREGTAVQMGGAIADGVSKRFELAGPRRTLLLLAGMAGGFASVFGTPFAGFVFGLEVVGFRGLRGKFGFERVLACGVSAVCGHLTVLVCGQLWGVHHTSYVLAVSAPYTLLGFASAAFAGALFGLLGWGFARATHRIGDAMRLLRFAPLRPLLGGVVIAILVISFRLERYTGLGLSVILESLQTEVPRYDFACKFLLTSLTLGAGFKGGEVTPLFFIGSTFGNTLGTFLPLPSVLLAAMGFVAVFGGAANVPLASTLMAFELFGDEGLFYFATACFVSYVFSGRHGIYRSQKGSNFRFKLYS